MEKPIYKILIGSTPTELEGKVQEMLIERYELSGGVCYDIYNKYYLQAVYKYQSNPIKLTRKSSGSDTSAISPVSG